MGVKATRQVAISELKPYPGNPRVHDVPAIRESLRTNGQYRAVVVRAADMTILAGHGTVEAAEAEGWRKVLAHLVDVDEERARLIVLADNRTAELGGYEDELLLSLLEASPVLEGSGWDEATLKALRNSLAEDRKGADTEPGPKPAQPRTRKGELVELGPHRLLCGDARKPEDLARLLDGERAELLWTDPPYGVDYTGKTARKLKLAADVAEGLEQLLTDAFAAVDGVLSAGAPLYVASPAGAMSVTFGRAFLGAGWRLHETLVWVKDSMVLGHADYHYRHEPILYGYTACEGRRGRGGEGWYGDNSQTSVFEVARPKASREHPTCKPVELVEAGLENSSARDAIVLDPFGGSGTTLIACENMGRRCFMIDVDPRYCDVIRDRYERHVA